MRFFLDENFPKSAHAFLGANGHEVFDVRGTPSEGADDALILAMAQAQEAVFLTTDLDFFHTVPWLTPVHHGVVVVALRKPNREAILSRLRWLFDRVDMASSTFRGNVFLLRDHTCRMMPGG